MNKFSIQNCFVISENSFDQMRIACAILESYNARASEIINAEWQLFFPNQFLILKGCKNSSNVIVRDKLILSCIEKLPHIDAKFIFPSVSYSKMYRFVKANYSHLFTKFKKRKNFKVTHGFRYLNVSQIGNETFIRDILHHRSTKSGKFYK
jgi:hypothetical protein